MVLEVVSCFIDWLWRLILLSVLREQYLFVYRTPWRHFKINSFVLWVQVPQHVCEGQRASWFSFTLVFCCFCVEMGCLHCFCYCPTHSKLAGPWASAFSHPICPLSPHRRAGSTDTVTVCRCCHVQPTVLHAQSPPWSTVCPSDFL